MAGGWEKSDGLKPLFLAVLSDEALKEETC